jgi:hypothetical protein
MLTWKKLHNLYSLKNGSSNIILFSSASDPPWIGETPPWSMQPVGEYQQFGIPFDE